MSFVFADPDGLVSIYRFKVQEEQTWLLIRKNAEAREWK
jgi:hypothetical protein